MTIAPLRFRPARRHVGPVTGALLLAVAAHAAAVAQIDSVTGKPRQPATINELVDAFVYTFENILTSKEFELFRTRSPDQVREESPQTWEKISQNVVRWTDAWIAYAEESLETVPAARLAEAHATAAAVDAMMAEEFAARGLDYRSLEVVFLPQRLFHDERNRYSAMGGMFIPFYPDVFFATINPSWPMELVLVHETIHFNKTGPTLGPRLTEGITEAAAEAIVAEHGIMGKMQLLQRGIYAGEVLVVEAIADAIVERRGGDRAEALDELLRVYLTGDDRPLRELFGEAAWERVLELSASRRWSRKAVVKALR